MSLGKVEHAIEGPNRHHTLHCVSAQLREVDVHIQQHLSNEGVKEQSEPSDKVVMVNGYEIGRRPGRLIDGSWEVELHIVRHVVILPDQRQLLLSHPRLMPINFKQ